MTATKRLRRTAILAAAALTLAACGGSGDSSSAPAPAPAPAPDQSVTGPTAEDFFVDQLITLTVPYSTGGGTDTTARFLAPFLESYVPGSPRVQVQNEPGANTLIGANRFAAGPPDGNWIFMSGAATTFNFLLANSDAEYDYGDWEPLLVSPQGNIVYVASNIGVTTQADLLNNTVPYVLPAQSVEGSDLVRVVSLDLLGLDFQVVQGYSGGGPARVAFEQGEANINGDTTSTYLRNVVPLVEEGKAIPMYSFGFIDAAGDLVRDPSAPDLPHVGEVYELIYGRPPAGEMWEAYKVLVAAYVQQKIVWIHKDAPEAAKEALRIGITRLVEDPAYLEGVEKVLGGNEFVIGDEAAAVVKNVSNPPQSALDWTYAYLLDNYDVDVLNR